MSELRKSRMLRVGNAYIADTATVTGKVKLGEDANIWYGVMIRGDDAAISIGARTNIQDNAVVHVDPGYPNSIGADCTIGHGALVHGVEVGDFALIGMGAILLGGTKVGEGAIIGAGALVLENTEIPPFSLVVGSPAKVIRQHEGWERTSQAIRHAAHYVEQAKRHCEGKWDGMVSC
ncbi:MAG: gamma carbonic anhydrase family protein [Planctomycetota bacterium]|nr:gamma carbonic anhydrase family protein [Planctomycetota bacterium]